MNFLVTGSSGQLGQAFRYFAPNETGVQFLFTDRQQLDITRMDHVQDYFNEQTIHACINCAAYTAVDRAESEPDQARLVNVTGIENLALACRSQDIPLIHFSTDYVYHHLQDHPYREDDPTHPRSVYAQTKLAGEQRALAQHPLSTIIRTSWVYSAYGHNFVKTMLRLGREKAEIRVVYDQIGAPTNAKDLAQVVLHLLRKCMQGDLSTSTLSGTFNYANTGACSWYDMAKLIMTEKNLSCRVHPILSHEFPSLSERPAYSLLDTQKIRRTFDIAIPYWRDSLLRCLQEM